MTGTRELHYRDVVRHYKYRQNTPEIIGTARFCSPTMRAIPSMSISNCKNANTMEILGYPSLTKPYQSKVSCMSHRKVWQNLYMWCLYEQTTYKNPANLKKRHIGMNGIHEACLMNRFEHAVGLR